MCPAATVAASLWTPVIYPEAIRKRLTILFGPIWLLRVTKPVSVPGYVESSKNPKNPPFP
jgi:hypothetical protein